MSQRVVSTKLTEEEHTKLLDLCNMQGCTPSALIKQAIVGKIMEESVNEVESTKPKKSLKRRRIVLTYKGQKQ